MFEILLLWSWVFEHFTPHLYHPPSDHPGLFRCPLRSDTNQTSSRLLLAMYALQLFCLCHTLSKYTVFTNALLQAFAPYCRVAIVRVKSTLAAKDDPLGNGEPTVMFLETSKMCVAHILPTPAGCVEARPGPPSHAPSKCGRERWRRFSSS